MRNIDKVINKIGKNNVKIASVPILWVLFGFILYPTTRTLLISLMDENSISLINYIEILTTKSHLTALLNSISLGVLTVIVCGIIGTMLAFLINFFDCPYRSVIEKIILLPMVLPGLIIVFAFVQLYGESGLVTNFIMKICSLEKIPFKFNGLWGILYVHGFTQYIYFYMSVTIGIKHIDKYAIEASRNLGATPFYIFKTIIIPFIKPSLIAASIMTFMTGIGSFSAPSIIGGSYRVMTTQILMAKANNYMGIASTQVVYLTSLGIMYFVLFRMYENKSSFELSTKGAVIDKVKIKNKIVEGLSFFILLFVVVSIILPVITVILLSFVKPGTWMISIYPREFSFDNYIKIFSNSRALGPFLNSIKMSVVAAVMCVVVAVPASYIVVKTKYKFKKIIEVLVMLPWAIPSSAIAINIINAFNHPNIFVGNKILVGTSILLPIAYFTSQLPLIARMTSSAFANINDDYKNASNSLGATNIYTYRHIILRMVAPVIMSAVALIIIRSVGEYTMSAFLYTPANKPISIAMVNSIFEYETSLAMAYGTLAILVVIIGTVLMERFNKN